MGTLLVSKSDNRTVSNTAPDKRFMKLKMNIPALDSKHKIYGDMMKSGAGRRWWQFWR